MERHTFRRDSSGGLINTDEDGLIAYKKQRDLANKARQELEERFQRIEFSLQRIIEHLGI